MNDLNELRELVRGTWPEQKREFRPCAFFDERLDCIRVIARDCSVLEERISDRLTVLMDNYPGAERKQYVGFTFKGARHFCQEQGWDMSTSIRMAELLDAILAKFPGVVVRWFVDIVARPLMDVDKIEQIEMPDGDLAPTFGD